MEEVRTLSILLDLFADFSGLKINQAKSTFGRRAATDEGPTFSCGLAAGDHKGGGEAGGVASYDHNLQHLIQQSL